MSESPATRRNPWLWIPSLYLAEGLPYVVVMTVSVIMYKGFGLSNTDIALYTSWLYLPWVVKPLWSPFVEIIGTRRRWIWVMQLLIGAGLAAVALAIPGPHFFQWTLVFFWLLAFSSATHDIAADGFYLLGTTERQAAMFGRAEHVLPRRHHFRAGAARDGGRRARHAHRRPASRVVDHHGSAGRALRAVRHVASLLAAAPRGGQAR
jgi:hypothetical protein